MLKFGLEIALGMIQKSDAAIFEILIFRNFSGGQSPNFGQNGRNGQNRHFEILHLKCISTFNLCPNELRFAPDDYTIQNNKVRGSV